MPKLKTHRGAAKRFKKTGTGKFMRGKAFKQPHPDEQDDEAGSAGCAARRRSPTPTQAKLRADAAVLSRRSGSVSGMQELQALAGRLRS